MKNTTVALRSDGTVQAVQLYAPYGSMRYTDGTIPTPSNFTGQRLDAQTGLLYYNSRYYDPVSGRFTSTDTVQTNAQGADTYAYVNDNPIGSTDPTGHCPWCLIGAAVGALIGAGVDYGMQVYNNYQSGDANPWTDVNWWDVGGAALVGGLIGFGLGPLIPAVGAMIGGAASTGSVGAGLAAGGGAFAAASGWLSGGVSSPEATQPEAPQPEAPTENVTYSRVQGGTPPNASRFRIFVKDDGSISIPDKSSNLNVSVGDGHASYFQGIRGGDSEVVKFDLPKWFDDFVAESELKQSGYRSNPLNQGRTLPKLVDPTTPGRSYEFPAPWIRWIEEYASNGRVSK